MKNDAPKVVKIHDVKIDQEYMQWLGEIKARYRNAQIKAAVKVNAEQVSLDLQAAFPESKGFSTSNLWYMKQWYQFYAAAIPKLQQFDGEFQIPDS